MTTTDLVAHGQAPSTTLTIADDQSSFTSQQVAALHHLGVENASPGDLGVFFHVVKRTGLDPFARQIYMIGRNTFDSRQGKWVTKQTIQTGIDGFRLIGRRAADARRESISVSAPEWAHQDGTWRPVWVPSWGMPIAARVTITRGGSPFTAVALFDEYKQTKKDGGLTQMWVQRPAGQIAKCAEALAWRMAFPQDLSGVYSDDEMQQADAGSEGTQVADRSGVSRLRAAVPHAIPDEVDQAFQTPAEDVHDAEAVDPEPADAPLITPAQNRKLHAMLRQAGAGEKDAALPLISSLVGRKVESTKDLTRAEANTVIDTLEQDTAEPATEGDDMFPPTDGGAA